MHGIQAIELTSAHGMCFHAYDLSLHPMLASYEVQGIDAPLLGIYHKRQFEGVTFSPMRGSTSLMTGLVFLAKARILARSVRILTGTKRAVATIAQFQKAASHISSFNPKTSISIQKHHPYTGMNSETSGDSKNTFLHCGYVLSTVGW